MKWECGNMDQISFGKNKALLESLKARNQETLKPRHQETNRQETQTKQYTFPSKGIPDAPQDTDSHPCNLYTFKDLTNSRKSTHIF